MPNKMDEYDRIRIIRQPDAREAFYAALDIWEEKHGALAEKHLQRGHWWRENSAYQFAHEGYLVWMEVWGGTWEEAG